MQLAEHFAELVQFAEEELVASEERYQRKKELKSQLVSKVILLRCRTTKCFQNWHWYLW